MMRICYDIIITDRGGGAGAWLEDGYLQVVSQPRHGGSRGVHCRDYQAGAADGRGLRRAAEPALIPYEVAAMAGELQTEQ